LNYSVLYIDGEAVATSTSFALQEGTDAHLTIGATFFADGTGQDCFNGALDDVYLYNDALSQGQIVTLMGLQERYFPIESPAELYDREPQNSRSIDLRDFSVLAENWREQQFWPVR